MVHWGANYFPICLPDHLLKRAKEMHCDMYYDGTFEGVKFVDGIPVVDGETGEVMLTAKGESLRRMNRQKIKILCSEGVHIEVSFRNDFSSSFHRK